MPQTAPVPGTLRITAGGATDVGRGRSSNADAVLVRPDLALYVIADGTGGAGGNVASALATTSIANYFAATERLADSIYDIDAFGLWVGARRLGAAVQKANNDVVEIAQTSNRHKRMGTTVVCASFTPDAGLVHIAHVGDSRAYRLRAGILEQLTFDHALINDVLELRPDIEDEALLRLPENVVTRALGTKEGFRVCTRTHAVVSGDRYLLCSDGLSDVLSDDLIASTLALKKTPEDLVRSFIQLANDSASQDNIAAIVISCELAPGTSFRERRYASSMRKLAPSVMPSSDSAEVPFAVTPEAQLRELDQTSLDANPKMATPRVHGSREKQPSQSRMKTPKTRGTLKMVRCPRCHRALDPSDPCPTCTAAKV